MTDNERLAKWQEWEEYHSDINKHVPDYLNDDDAAMSLLDTLVEKGYTPVLQANGRCGWSLNVWNADAHIWVVANINGTTRRAAVCAAVLELIDKGDV